MNMNVIWSYFSLSDTFYGLDFNIIVVFFHEEIKKIRPNRFFTFMMENMQNYFSQRSRPLMYDIFT